MTNLSALATRALPSVAGFVVLRVWHTACAALALGGGSIVYPRG